MHREDIHKWVFLGATALLMVGIPLSHYLMSLSQLILAGNWLLEGQFRRKWSRIRAHPEVWVFLAIFMMHVLGLLHTIDFQYAIKDLRTKLPLLLLPLVFITAHPIKQRKINVLLLVYVGAVVFGTIRSTIELAVGNIGDIRHISVYISHIRFSLNICLAIFVLVWMLARYKFTSSWKFLVLTVITIWLMVFLFILQSMTGLIVFLFTVFVLMIRQGILQPKGSKRVLSFSVAVFIPLIAIAYVGFLIHSHARIDEVDFSALDVTTSRGEAYHHDTLNCQTVNGHYVWIYLAENELREAWNARSEMDYDGTDRQGHQLRDIIIRYLTSQGLRKDADGLERLNDAEIDIIEEGRANASCDGPNVVKARICEILWEYRNYQCTGDPSGHSVLMRYEYWKASVHIIRNNFWKGVGTGDMNLAFRDSYDEIESQLRPEWRLRSHNQFLSIFVGFGIFGLIIFLFSILYPIIRLRPFSGFLFTAFMSIVLLSMVTEDTIESQAGVTFFTFFYCFLLFVRKEQECC